MSTSSMTDRLAADYNFGTLLRVNARDEFTESNAMFCLRAQAYAIEIARNVGHMNDWVYEVGSIAVSVQYTHFVLGSASQKSEGIVMTITVYCIHHTHFAFTFLRSMRS